jgi:hypothetical protein
MGRFETGYFGREKGISDTKDQCMSLGINVKYSIMKGMEARYLPSMQSGRTIQSL